jgi:septum formation protein
MTTPSTSIQNEQRIESACVSDGCDSRTASRVTDAGGNASAPADHPQPSLILASGSPRRRELLSELGVPFRVVVSDAPEDLDPALDPEAQAIALAARKARAVAAGIDEGFILGADTIVLLDGDILGKPADDADAARMLRRLSGRAHDVITGLALVDAGSGEERTGAVQSTVTFRPLADKEIARYVATGEPRDKAGGYAIQGIGGELIARMEGCFANVVGLPLCAVSSLLTEAGILIPADWAGCRLPDGSRCPRGV